MGLNLTCVAHTAKHTLLTCTMPSAHCSHSLGELASAYLKRPVLSEQITLTSGSKCGQGPNSGPRARRSCVRPPLCPPQFLIIFITKVNVRSGEQDSSARKESVLQHTQPGFEPDARTQGSPGVCWSCLPPHAIRLLLGSVPAQVLCAWWSFFPLGRAWRAERGDTTALLRHT